MSSPEDTLKGDPGIRDNFVAASQFRRLGARARGEWVSYRVHGKRIRCLSKYIKIRLYSHIY